MKIVGSKYTGRKFAVGDMIVAISDSRWTAEVLRHSTLPDAVEIKIITAPDRRYIGLLSTVHEDAWKIKS